jgi:deoxyadenosine/deoxycytidine kinase
MKRLKRLSKSKKPTVVFIYGPIAVGKLTVAKILSKKLGYKLTHNHALNNMVDELFTRGTHENGVIKDRLRYDLIESAVKAKINFVTTHCYAQNYVSTAGLTDPKYVETLAKNVAKLGANFYPVHLKANDKELLRRVSMNSRKEFRKLTDKKIMRKIIHTHDWQTSPSLKNNLVIDNTNLSPKKVSDMTIKHFKLK